VKLSCNEYWHLWTTLAWVLTRDREFTKRAGPRDFEPHPINRVSETETGKGWRVLFDALGAGSISLTGMPIGRTGNPDQPAPPTGTKRKIPPKIVRSLDWGWLPADLPWLRRKTRFGRPGQYVGYWNVRASSREVLLRFPQGSDPIAHKMNPTAPMIHPEGQGYMGLSAAVCWIACEGGTVSFFNRDKEAWSAGFAKLLPAITSGDVEVIGRRKGLALPDRISAIHFSSIVVDHPYQDLTCLDLLLGERPHLKCWGCCYEDGWEYCSDELWGFDARAPEYTHLQVRKEDVRRLWPFEPAQLQIMNGPDNRPKKGAKPQYDWPDVKQFIYKTMNERGEFRDWDVDWKSQAELEREVMQYLDNRPSESTVRRRVTEALRIWRENPQARLPKGL
jgi:hypothetical protein